MTEASERAHHDLLHELTNIPDELSPNDATREQLEDALRHTRGALDSFRSIAESTMAGLHLIEDGVFQYVNPAFVQLFGYQSARDVIGRKPTDFVYPDDQAKVAEFIRRQVEGEVEAVHYSFRGLRADGSQILCEVLGRAIQLRGRQVLVGTVFDITERNAVAHEREQLLQEAQARLERETALKEATSVFASTLEVDRLLGHLAETEEALRDTISSLSGSLNLDELLDRILENVGRVLPHDTADIMLLHGVGEQRELQAVRGRGYRERGTEDWLLQLRVPWRDMQSFRRMEKSGRPVAISDTQGYPGWVVLEETEWVRSYAAAPLRHKGQTIGFLNLCSELPGTYGQAHAESLQVFADQAAVAIENARLYSQAQDEIAERKRAERSLRSSEQRYRSVFQGVREAIFVESLSGEIMQANGSACEMYGWSGEQIIGKGLIDLVPEAEPILLQARRDPQSLPVRPLEFNSRRANGQSFPIELQFRLHRLDDQEVLLVVGRDITDRKLAEEAERELVRMKVQFILSASHSLRTPLHTLMGFLELVNTGKVASAERQADFLRRAADDAARIYALISDLMDSARIEIGEQGLQLEALPVDQFVDQVLAAREPDAEAAGVRVLHDRGPSGLTIQADGRRLGAAIDAILHNAIRYSPAGSEIRVAVDRADGELTIEIGDTGPGIPATDLQALLGRPPSEAADGGSSISTSSGPGLGLYLANSIVRAHGGRLEIDSQVGHGTTVRLKLTAR